MLLFVRIDRELFDCLGVEAIVLPLKKWKKLVTVRVALLGGVVRFSETYLLSLLQRCPTCRGCCA